MKSPRKSWTVRELIAVISLFAVDFGGIARVVRRDGPARGGGTAELVGLVCICGTILLLLALIYLHVPPPLDEVLAVILILIVLVGLIVPALQHS